VSCEVNFRKNEVSERNSLIREGPRVGLVFVSGSAFGLTMRGMAHTVASKRRKELRKELALLEKQIFDLETTYLEETKEIGNIFHGWNSYLSTEKVKGKKVITNEERLFSLSSVTSPASKKSEKDGGAGSAKAGASQKRKADEQ
jgi:Histone acetyltransferase subunit NuA4